jgi:hypothetical protein
MRESVGVSKSKVAPDPERRRTPRLVASFPAAVVGAGAAGGAFELSTELDNISAGGLYLRLGRRVETGATLLVVVHLCAAGRETRDTARVAIDGLVLRADAHAGGRYGLAIKITNHRFL